MTLGRAIAVARTACGLSQGQLAAQAQCSPALLSMMERGKRKASRKALLRVAAALQIDLALLYHLGGESAALSPVGREMLNTGLGEWLTTRGLPDGTPSAAAPPTP